MFEPMQEQKAKPQTALTTRPRKVLLNELVSSEQVGEYTTVALSVPVEFYTDDQGRQVVIAGHECIHFNRCRVEMKLEGYASDMQVDAVEVVGATPEELQIRAVMANLIRRPLSDADRTRSAEILRRNGMPPELVGL